MKDEQTFRKLMIQVRALAKKQEECISKEKIGELFCDMELTEEQLEHVFQYLLEEKVTIVDDEKAYEDYLQSMELADEKTKQSAVDSAYLKMYLDELEELEKIDRTERLKRVANALAAKDSIMQVLPTLYLREVVDIARLYAGQGVVLEDLIGEGNVALLLGAKMADCCESEAEVEELLIKMVMDAMEALILEKSTDDNLNMQVLERVNNLNEKAEELAEELGRKVTSAELVKELDMDQDELEKTIQLSGDTIEFIEHIESEN